MLAIEDRIESPACSVFSPMCVCVYYSFLASLLGLNRMICTAGPLTDKILSAIGASL